MGQGREEREHRGRMTVASRRGSLPMRAAAAFLVALACASASAADVVERPIAALAADLASGRTSSVALVEAYLARIRTLDARLHAILAINPHARADARALDRERRAGHVRGPLHGIPIVIKDNVETKELPTTAGSLALAANLTGRDAPLVAQLRAAGAIVLGKTNLSEWANFRSDHSISGWSAVGGLTRNPYVLDRSACGSSSGTGAGVAASFAAAGIGSETDGSITCPSSMNGLVGLKPTAGLVSQKYIVPISHTQDTAGPMGRTVHDVALLLNAIATRADRCDDSHACATTDFTAGLDRGALRGARIGVVRSDAGALPVVGPAFEHALAALREAGATLVDIEISVDPKLGDAENRVLDVEFKVDVEAYLADAAPAVQARTLAALIAFNAATPAELALFGQETFVKAEGMPGLDDPVYRDALATERRAADTEGLGRALAEQHLDAIVTPTTGPAWRIDTVNGDAGGASYTTLPAVSGYPHLTVPMALIRELPAGLSFIGAPGSDAKLLGYGFAFEAKAQARRPPRFLKTVDEGR
jgi:amidase